MKQEPIEFAALPGETPDAREDRRAGARESRPAAPNAGAAGATARSSSNGELRRQGKQGPGRITHQSLERGLHVLETVASTGALISLGEAARRTGLHRSTTHHLLQTLVGVGYVRQDARTRSYELTDKLFRLTGRMWTPEQLGELAQPFVAELTRVTGEGASLAAYRDGVISIVAKRDSDGPVRVVQSLGAQRPIHATAVAKAIVAFLPRSERDGVLARVRFERYTPKTIVTAAALEAELERIRAAGYAHDDEEHIEGIRCIAAPVFAYTGQVVASLCAVGPRSRMTRQKLRAVRPTLLGQCVALSERLGWRPETGNVAGPLGAYTR